MRHFLAAGMLVIIACVIVAGCVLDRADTARENSTDTIPALEVTPAEDLFPTLPPAIEEPADNTTVPETTPTLSLGDHYLQRAYAFHNGSTSYTEQIRVDDPSWGITLSIIPLKDDPEDCWFEMTVINIDTGQSRTFGYGRTYTYETYQQYPMYTTGAYRISMTGDLIRVDLNVAKRLP